jgi:hypothetical protein
MGQQERPGPDTMAEHDSQRRIPIYTSSSRSQGKAWLAELQRAMGQQGRPILFLEFHIARLPGEGLLDVDIAFNMTSKLKKGLIGDCLDG